MKKFIIGVPLLSLALVIALIVAVNLDDSKMPVAKEPAEEAEAEVQEISEQNPANPKGVGQQTGFSDYDSLDHFVTSVYEQWHAIHEERRYTYDISGTNFQILSTVVRETNYWQPAIEELQLTREFDAMQSTAFQIASPLSELHDQQKANKLFEFENQLEIIHNRINIQ